MAKGPIFLVGLIEFPIAPFLLRMDTLSGEINLSELFFITKTCLYNFDPLKPNFYIVKLGFTWVYIIFLISAQKHRLWVLVRTAAVRRF